MAEDLRGCALAYLSFGLALPRVCQVAFVVCLQAAVSPEQGSACYTCAGYNGFPLYSVVDPVVNVHQQ